MTEEQKKFLQDSNAEPANQTLAQKAAALFNNPELSSRLTDLLVSKRPVGVSRKCSYPYYKEYYARLIQIKIDEQIKDRKMIIFRYSDYCNDTVSKDTLYHKVNQSIRYLCDNLDPQNIYRQWRACVNVRRDKQLEAVTIRLIPELESGGELKSFGGDIVEPKNTETTPAWKQEMDRWLESDSNKPFLREGLALTTDQIAELKTELKSLRGIMFDVQSKHIKIIR